MMERIFLVSKNAFRGILHARSLYLWIIAVLLVGAQLAPQIIFRDNLPNFPNFAAQRPMPETMSEQQKKEMREALQKQQEIQRQQFQEAFRRGRPRALAGGLNTWTSLAILFSVLLGANALANEVAAKTIITVLARPISRWELLLGKWLAIQVFGVMSLAVGVGIHLLAGWYLSISFSSLLWLALLHAMIGIMLYSAMAMALGTVSGPLIAAAITAFVYFFAGIVTFLRDSQTTWVHWLGQLLNVVIPPVYNSIFPNAVDAAIQLDRSALSKTMLENLAFLAVFFVLSCVIFTRREVRLG